MKRGWVKGICAILCVLTLNVGIWGCVLGGLWLADRDGGFWQSFLYNEVRREYVSMVDEVIDLKNEEKAGTLSVYASQRLAELTEKLDADNTNFRFAASLNNGSILYANAGDTEQWRGQVYAVGRTWREYYESDMAADPIAGEPVDMDDALMSTATYTGYNSPVVRTDDTADGGWTEYRIDYGVIYPLRGEDGFTQACALYDTLDDWAGVVLAGSIVCCAAALVLLIALMCAAGRRRGREGVVLNWHDKIPYDLYLCIQGAAHGCIWGLGFVEGIWLVECSHYQSGLALTAGMGLLGSILALALLLTTVTRIKARTIFRNTVIGWLCRWCWRGVKRLFRALRAAFNALPLLGKAGAVCGGYVVLGLIFAVCSPFCWLVLTAVLMAYVCWWILQWKLIRQGTEQIIGGDTSYQIESAKMPPDLKQHADELNNLGQAVSAAVDERMKSEHFKAELITNVSHDLKTPLTSIISYVDLLKKEEIDNETAREYIDVLDRKSQRLKKLTEDLVEASKASTGALTVNRERLDLVQLIRQALGEYEEKLTGAGLALVTTLPEKPVFIRADGRHVWRVLDNLLNNCAKYALTGTRVYLELAVREGNAAITVKNISREALNVPPEQLMERFVRGDEARTTEGSGLGLSIARSLTELQGGRFALDIDGDLFKALVLFPLDGNA